MNSERFHRIMGLFREACEVDGAERIAMLDRECGTDADLRREVEQLLAADGRSESGNTPVSVGDGPQVLAAEIASGRGRESAAEETAPVNMPERLGKYEVIEKIGEGGMGVVYLGLQQSPQRKVALKVLKPNATTAGTLRRFEHEALVLGWLNHDGIARIYEADAQPSAGGSMPYIAMEHVAGTALNQYLRDQAPPPSIEERLRLFLRVCDAVSYAHQQGIIHRDLKPTNVLVDDSGRPKVLDFGVARLLDDDLQAVTLHTSAGEVIGTLAYMSPEQVAGQTHEVDTRTDIYALGVILYEMLSGRHPHDIDGLSWIDAGNVIRDHPPVPLASVNPRLRGDLATIVHKALAKEKARRYQSVSEFAGDIELFLADQPISARRDSAIYVLRKTIQRHRWAVGAAAAFVLLISVAAVALGIMYRREARASRQAALARDEEAAARAQAETVNTFLQNMIFGAHPTEYEVEPTVRDLLRQAESSIDEELADKPRVKASMLLAICHARVGLGDYDVAERAATEALSIYRETLGDEHPEIASALHALATVRLEQGRYDEADARCRETLVMRRKLLGNDHDAVIESMALLARIRSERGMDDEAVALYRDVLDVSRRRDSDSGRRVATTLNDLAVCLERAGKLPEAEAKFREALALQRAQLGERHLEVAVCLANLGTLQLAMERPEDAVDSLREALSIYRERVGDKHPSTIRAMSNLSGALRELGQLDEARALIDEVLAVQRERLGPTHPDVAMSLNNLSNILISSGDYQGALAPARESLDVVRAAYGERHALVGKAMLNLARVTDLLGEQAESDKWMDGAMDILRGALDESDPGMATMLHNYALRLVGRGEFESAEAAMREAVGIAERSFDAGHPIVAQFRNGLGVVLFKKGDLDGAATQFEAALKVLETLPMPQRGVASETMENLAGIKQRRGEYAEAESLYERSLALRRKALPPKHPGIALCLMQIGRLYLERGEDGDAERALTALRESHEIRAAVLPPTHWQVIEATDLLADALIRLKQYDEAESLLTTCYDRVSESEPDDPDDSKPRLARRFVELYEASGDRDNAERWHARVGESEAAAPAED